MALLGFIKRIFSKTARAEKQLDDAEDLIKEHDRIFKGIKFAGDLEPAVERQRRISEREFQSTSQKMSRIVASAKKITKQKNWSEDEEQVHAVDTALRILEGGLNEQHRQLQYLYVAAELSRRDLDKEGSRTQVRVPF